MSLQSPKNKDSVQSQVELLVGEAKKHNGAGDEALALDCYRQAAALMPGAPWLQHRTAEIARKLKQYELAAVHYRRAAAAFVAAGFPKRAVAPLRVAWQSSLVGLPGQSEALITVTLELAHVQRTLGLSPEAAMSISSANQALRSSGSADRVPVTTESEAPTSGVKSEPLRRLA
ncbi:MAG: hypothetical protein ABJB12_04340 [Pseudomonadota bacterium]